MFHDNLGFGGTPPADYRMQRFWYTMIVLGQLHARLVKPYQRIPLQMAQLVDSSVSDDDRLQLAQNMCQLSPCCVESMFGAPVLQCISDNGGPDPDTILRGPIASDLQVAFRGKTSNMEIELNFARASCSRQCLHGRAHNIGSMVAKHVSAEVKLGHCRSLTKHEGKPSKPDAPGLICTSLLDHMSFVSSAMINIYHIDLKSQS